MRRGNATGRETNRTRKDCNALGNPVRPPRIRIMRRSLFMCARRWARSGTSWVLDKAENAGKSMFSSTQRRLNTAAIFSSQRALLGSLQVGMYRRYGAGPMVQGTDDMCRSLRLQDRELQGAQRQDGVHESRVV